MGRVYRIRIGIAAKNGSLIKLSTGLLAKSHLKRVDAKAHVDELQHDAPDGLDVFEFLTVSQIAFIEEVRKFLRIKLNGQIWRRVSFVDGCLNFVHGGCPCGSGGARPEPTGRALKGLKRVVVRIGEALFLLRFRLRRVVAAMNIHGRISLARQFGDAQQFAS